MQLEIELCYNGKTRPRVSQTQLWGCFVVGVFVVVVFIPPPSNFSLWVLNQAIHSFFSSALQTSSDHHEPKGQSSSA